MEKPDGDVQVEGTQKLLNVKIAADAMPANPECVSAEFQIILCDALNRTAGQLERCNKMLIQSEKDYRADTSLTEV